MSFIEQEKKKFRKEFFVKDKTAIDGYAVLLLKATVSNLESFNSSSHLRLLEYLRERVVTAIRNHYAPINGKDDLIQEVLSLLSEVRK